MSIVPKLKDKNNTKIVRDELVLLRLKILNQTLADSIISELHRLSQKYKNKKEVSVIFKNISSFGIKGAETFIDVFTLELEKDYIS